MGVRGWGVATVPVSKPGSCLQAVQGLLFRLASAMKAPSASPKAQVC